MNTDSNEERLATDEEIAEMFAEMDRDAAAAEIYSEIYGDIDNKHFKAAKIGEITDWLQDGDPDYSDFAGLLAEWRAYDAAEIEARNL